MRFLARLAAFSIALVYASVATAEPETLTLVFNPWPPYAGEALRNNGLSTDIVRTAFERAGYRVEVEELPWARALKGTLAGRYDGLITAWYSAERDKELAFSAPYAVNEIKLVKRRGREIHFENLEDLKGLTIGVGRDYAYDPEFDAASFLDKEEAVDAYVNLKKVAAGRIDLAVVDERVFRSLVRRALPDLDAELALVERPLAIRPLHMVITRKRPDHAKVIASFNTSLAAMKADGTYQSIVDKHSSPLHSEEGAKPSAAPEAPPKQSIEPKPEREG